MQTIPTSYKQAGRVLSLVKRQDKVAMFHDGGNYWEIHKIDVEPAREIFGKPYPKRETLASNEEFGNRAWACSTQERADFRFQHALSL